MLYLKKKDHLKIVPEVFDFDPIMDKVGKEGRLSLSGKFLHTQSPLLRLSLRAEDKEILAELNIKSPKLEKLYPDVKWSGNSRFHFKKLILGYDKKYFIYALLDDNLEFCLGEVQYLSEDSKENIKKNFIEYKNHPAVSSIVHRLANGTHVGKKQNYVYVATPKAACSTMKRVLMYLDDIPFDPRQIGRESSQDMAVHYRNINHLKNLFNFDKNTQRKLLYSADVVRFCIVRNPHARLFSAWSDKLLQNEPGYHKTIISINAVSSKKEHFEYPSFQDFVHWLNKTQDVTLCNPHWRTMTSLLMPDLIKYTHVLRTETLSKDFQEVLDIIEPGSISDNILEAFRINESLPLDWQEYYDEETYDIVSELYFSDFMNFGYNISSWSAVQCKYASQEGVDTLKEKFKSLEQSAIKAIQARNRTIQELLGLNRDSTAILTPKSCSKNDINL